MPASPGLVPGRKPQTEGLGMVSRNRRTIRWGSLGILGALAAVIAVVANGPAALAGHTCNNQGETTFKFNLPDGVTIKPTHGAVKRGPSKIKMGNCGGSFDPATGIGSVVLDGGVNFKFEKNRGPTGDYRIRYGGVGKLRARVVGEPANIAKVSGGGPTEIVNAKLKLTTKGANLLNDAVDSTDGPWEEGPLGTVTTTFPST